MRYHQELRYPAPADDVIAMLLDQDYREQVCIEQQVVRYHVSIEETGSGTAVDIMQVQSLRGVADAVRRYVGNEIEVTQKEVWQDSRSASLDVRVPGHPGRMVGTITLTTDPQNPGSTVETVSGDIKVSVPFIGRKIEEMMAKVFGYALQAEHTVGLRWLATEE